LVDLSTLKICGYMFSCCLTGWTRRNETDQLNLALPLESIRVKNRNSSWIAFLKTKFELNMNWFKFPKTQFESIRMEFESIRMKSRKILKIHFFN
jgi:hypothetical protein